MKPSSVKSIGTPALSPAEEIQERLELGCATAEDLAVRLNVHIKTVRRFVREGRLDCHRVGPLLRFSATHVEKFLRSESARRK